MKKNPLVISALLLFVLIFGMASCATTKQTFSTEDLLRDVYCIQLDMEYSALKVLYDPEPFEQIKADLADGKIDRKECIYRLQEIICGYHVVHLRLTTTKDNQDFTANILPLIFKCFGNDIHIVMEDGDLDDLAKGCVDFYTFSYYKSHVMGTRPEGDETQGNVFGGYKIHI